MTTYPLAPQGVFRTIQGEGVMLGVPMVFVRFAGCPVGCPQCDTDYTVVERVSLDELARRVAAVAGRVSWVWLTGGEPTVHDLPPLTDALQRTGFRVALATAGINPVSRGHGIMYPRGNPDFVSVSPHRLDASWVQRRGEQLNVVPGLNGLALADLEGIDTEGFAAKFITPLYLARAGEIAELAEWVAAHPDWRLGAQAHKTWGLP